MWKTRSAVRPKWQAFEMEGEGNLGARPRARDKGWGGGGGGGGQAKIVILSTSPSTQIPNHKTSQKNTTSANKTVNKLLDRGS